MGSRPRTFSSGETEQIVRVQQQRLQDGSPEARAEQPGAPVFIGLLSSAQQGINKYVYGASHSRPGKEAPAGLARPVPGLTGSQGSASQVRHTQNSQDTGWTVQEGLASLAGMTNPWPNTPYHKDDHNHLDYAKVCCLSDQQ